MNTYEEDSLIGYCHRIFEYEPETGYLRRIRSQGRRGKFGTVAGCLNHEGYVKVKIDSTTYLAHRLIFGMVYNYFPSQVDHINRVRNDNRLLNIRSATHTQNQHNKTAGRNSVSGIIGVTWCKIRRRWVVQIQLDKIRNNLGYYETFDEAKAVRQHAEQQMFREFAPSEGRSA